MQPQPQSEPQPGPRPSVLGMAAFVLALVAHFVIAIPLLSLGLVAPLYAIVIFWLLWGFMLWVLLRLRRGLPLLAPLGAGGHRGHGARRVDARRAAARLDRVTITARPRLPSRPAG